MVLSNRREVTPAEKAYLSFKKCLSFQNKQTHIYIYRHTYISVWVDGCVYVYILCICDYVYGSVWVYVFVYVRGYFCDNVKGFMKVTIYNTNAKLL